MKNSLDRLLRLAPLLLVLTCALAQAAPRAWLDRDTARLGETVTLNVEVEQSSAAAPDFSALEKDFRLLGTQSSSQLSIVNGKTSAKTLWAVGLEPKHAGSLVIPALSVGGAQTAPIPLEVRETAAPAAPGGDVFIELAAEPLDPLVQQQVRCTVKLYSAFDLGDGNLSEPTADGLDVRRLGQAQDGSYLTSLDGRRYRVYERHYALIPQRSGTLEVPPVSFVGSVLDGNDPGGFFSRGRRVSLRSQPLQLEVRPRPPDAASGDWLPARSLELEDQLPLPDEVRVGEPLTRGIRVEAQGLAADQLPELELVAPDGVPMYADKAEVSTRDDGHWLYGQRARKFAFVPTRVGTWLIPGLRLQWWDTANGRLETASLPAHRVKVLPAAAAATPIPALPGSPPGNVQLAPWIFGALSPAGFWPWLSGALLALWLATLLLWMRARRAVATPSPLAPPPSVRAQRAEFQRACALGDLAGAERALLAWARRERAGLNSLGELARRLADPAQQEVLEAVERARYGREASEGLAVRMRRAFADGPVWADAITRAGEEAPALPPLYPPRR